MHNHPNKPSKNQNFLSDILNESGKEKVKLTPEIEKEIRNHLAEAQARMSRRDWKPISGAFCYSPCCLFQDLSLE